MLYTGTTLDITLNLKENGLSVPLDGATVVVVVKNKSTRFERQATVIGDGKCVLTLSSDDTSTNGNYHIQPIITTQTSQLPGSVRTFELKDRL